MNTKIIYIFSNFIYPFYLIITIFIFQLSKLKSVSEYNYLLDLNLIHLLNF